MIEPGDVIRITVCEGERGHRVGDDRADLGSLVEEIREAEDAGFWVTLEDGRFLWVNREFVPEIEYAAPER